MTTLAAIQTRTAQVLQDNSNTRFSASLLEEAVRLALTTFDQRLPRVTSCDLTAAVDGRDQTFTMPDGFLYLVGARFVREQKSGRELEPGEGFTYQVEDGKICLHFCGRRIPRVGDTLRVSYAACYTLAGLDDAAATTLPARYESALVTGAAGHACLLRATALIEAYGPRTEEVTRLMEVSRLHLLEFSQTLGQLKSIQEFGFPAGFPLDAEDSGSGAFLNG